MPLSGVAEMRFNAECVRGREHCTLLLSVCGAVEEAAARWRGHVLELEVGCDGVRIEGGGSH